MSKQRTSEQASPEQKDTSTRVNCREEDYFGLTRGGRVTSSSFAIAWSIVLLIFFVFFNHYIAYYQPETAANVTHWVRYPVLTGGFYTWLPLLVVTLVLTIGGHIILIIFDRHLLRQIILLVLNVLGLATVLGLLFIFPFDFSRMPNPTAATVLPVIIVVVLVATGIGLGIGAIVRFIQLIVYVSAPKT